MSKLFFEKEFTLQEPLPQESIDNAINLLRNGRLHRYNVAHGEISPVSLLEKEYAEYVGAKYCLGLSSCGSAIYVALRSVGVKPGDKVLCNAFTLAPVPGAIENAGAEPIFVEINENYTIDFADLEEKARHSGAKFLLLSHMRGHIADMDALSLLCQKNDMTLIEDCAHTVGAKWNNRFTGTFGKVGCYSTQTYKHMNSGEGGLLVSDDADVIAKAILYSGSYMLYGSHLSRPDVDVFEKYKKRIPNYSLRMSSLVAVILRPQLRYLDHQIERWNERYRVLEKELSKSEHIQLPKRSDKEEFVASSCQFTVKETSIYQVEKFVSECNNRGVELKWFGAKEPHGFTSKWNSWQYFRELPELNQSETILDFLCDFRIPLTFSLEDCALIATIICQVASDVLN